MVGRVALSAWKRDLVAARLVVAAEGGPGSQRSAGTVALARVRASMTRWIAIAFSLCSLPLVVTAMARHPASAQSWTTLGLASVFVAAAAMVGRYPGVAAQFVSVTPFVATLVGAYYGFGSGISTLAPMLMLCVLIAGICWSFAGSFFIALLGGAAAMYNLHLHTALSAYEANIAAGKVIVMLVVVAVMLRAVVASLVRAHGEVVSHEQRMQSLIRESHDGMLVLGPEGRVRLANPSAVRMSARAPDALLGRRLEELDWFDEASLRALEGQMAAPDGGRPCELQSEDGLQVLEASLSKLTRSEGDWNHLLALRDMTAKRAERHAQEEVQRRIRESNSLESLGRLAGGIAHDFNNLLTVILSTAELALTRKDLPQGLADDLATVEGAALRAASLTGQLLAVARKQVLRPRVLCPNQVIRDLFPLLQRLLPESVTARLHFADGLGNVSIDPTQLEQVLVNLVTNAVEAMPGGGTLTLETRDRKLDQAYADDHPGVTSGDYVQLSVSDTGLGMSEQTLSRVFEPFFTTKAKERGTGLGLATVHGIIRQSGGHVHVYSEPGQGTSFRIYLPRVAEAATTPEAPSVARAPSRPLHILLVEDQQAVRESVRSMLERLGHSVSEARDGQAALELEPQKPGGVDLLFTDVVMPEINGPRLAAALQARQPGLRVLYMSGYTENAIVHHGALDPGVEYLSKPFSLRALEEAIERAMA